MKYNFGTIILSVGLAVSSVFSIAQASDDNFYQGKTVELLVGNSPGGGYDTYSRTLARHLSNHIPGNPNVVVKNVPGAGSLVLMNQLANSLPKDGTVIGSIGRGLAFEPLFGNENARFDAAKTNWLGSLNSEASLCVAWHDAEVQTWKDLLDKKLVVGAAGASGDTSIFPRVLSDVLGFNFAIVGGYPGSNDILLALEQGEIEGICSWSYSSAKPKREEWLNEGKINILFQMALKKHAELPDVPLVLEFSETERERDILTLLFSRQAMGRPFVTPAGVPEERVSILRQAMAATAKDPDFLADAKNQNIDIDFLSGEEIQQIVAKAYNYPDEVVEAVKDAIQ